MSVDLPKSLQNIMSGKHATLSSFANLVDFFNRPDTMEKHGGGPLKAFILTSAGQIEVDFESEEDDGDFDFTRKMYDMIIDGRQKMIKLAEEESGHIDVRDSGTIIRLRNATLKPWSNPDVSYRYDHLAIFASEVMGFTFSNTPATVTKG